MQERNRYMVDRSSLLLAVYDDRAGGTFSTVKYAEKKNLTIVVLPARGLKSEQSKDT